MHLHFRRRLWVEGLETRMLLAADLAPISEANVAPAYDESCPPFVTNSEMLDQSELVEISQESSSVGGRTNSAASTVRLTPESGFGLAEAIAAAGRRGTVIVEAGVYVETSPVVITEPVTIVGEEGAVIEFDSQVSTASLVVIDPGIHIKNTQHVQIKGLEIRDSDGGSTAILIEGSEHVSIENNRITDFQYGVLVESADHSTVIGNEIRINVNMPAVTLGITVANGFGNQVRGNTVSGATFGIFASGTNGKVLHNTTRENVVGIILCNVPTNMLLPGADEPSGAEVPATGWLVQGNTSTHNATAGYLVIDNANRNVLTNNVGHDNGTFDIDLTADTYRFGFLTPASFENIVNAGSDRAITINDCGIDNKVHGGDQVEDGPCD